MSQHSHWSSLVAALGLLAGLSGCGGDGDDTNSSANPATTPSSGGGGSTPGTATPSKDALVIMTERNSPDGAFHYLHVLPDWPADGHLDFMKSVELGEPGVAHVEGDAFYHWRGKQGRFEKITIDDKLQVQPRSSATQISFTGYGIQEYDPEPIYVSPELAFMVDDKSGQIARFNPAALKIEEVLPLNPAVSMRDGVKGQLQLGLAASGRLFTTASWYDYKGHGVKAAAIGVFDQKNPANGPQLIEDPRCAYTVANGVWEDDQYVYVASDAATAFAVFADPVAKSTLPQCVLRMRKDGNAFDRDYLVDLQKVTGSPGIRMTWPMKGNKLLVNLWSPQIDPATVIKPGDDKTFWEAKAWAYAVVDLTTRTSTLVASIPPAKQESVKLLLVDEQNYLQVYREDRSSMVYRVNPDATVVQVLDLPTGANVQFLGRLKPAVKAK